MSISLKVNGQAHDFDGDDDTPLLWALRETLGMTGTKFGCGVASCGACTVYFNGNPVRSCSFPVAAAVGGEITTIEGLDSPEGKAVRKAWVDLQVPQCGWCQSGQIMAAAALLKINPKPNDAVIDSFMSGNVCRCATYKRIRAAIHEAAKTLEA